MYSALYLPSRPPNKEDPSRADFPTREAAEEYVFSQMCSACRDERQQALAGVVDPEDPMCSPSTHPGCYYEWLIGLTEEFENANDDEGFMEAGGWKRVYSRPEGASE